MIAAGYTIDLYCDVEGCPYDAYRLVEGQGFGQFVGETWGKAAAEARLSGWVISRDRTKCACPECVKAGRKYS